MFKSFFYSLENTTVDCSGNIPDAVKNLYFQYILNKSNSINELFESRMKEWNELQLLEISSSSLNSSTIRTLCRSLSLLFKFYKVFLFPVIFIDDQFLFYLFLFKCLKKLHTFNLGNKFNSRSWFETSSSISLFFFVKIKLTY